MTTSNTNEITVTDAAITAALSQAQSESAPAAKAEKKIPLTPAQRKERDDARRAGVEQRAAERAAKKAEREAARANRPAHMAKVSKAAELLPSLTSDVQSILEAATGLSTADQQALVLHLQHSVRVNATAAAVNTVLEVGQLVRIDTHRDAKNIGLLATVTDVRRITAHVEALDGGRRIYVLKSNLVPVTEAEALEAGFELVAAETAEAV